MLERQRNIYFPFNSETVADEALLQGRTGLAESILQDAIKNRYEQDAKAYPHLVLKLAAMPLYELFHTAPVNGDAEAAKRTVYKSTAGLISHTLNSPDYSSPHDSVRWRRVGDVTEGVFLGLSARDATSGIEEATVPASQFDDKYSKIDFVTHPFDNPTEPIRRFQTKTKAEGKKPQTVNGITLVGMNHVDPDFFTHHHYDSVANCMVRELAGTASWQDIEKLDQATKELSAIAPK